MCPDQDGRPLSMVNFDQTLELWGGVLASSGNADSDAGT
jgi:hypothetical protein